MKSYQPKTALFTNIRFWLSIAALESILQHKFNFELVLPEANKFKKVHRTQIFKYSIFILMILEKVEFGKTHT